MDSACFTPYFDKINSPIINGIINSKISTSDLSWYEKEVNPIQNSFNSKVSCVVSPPEYYIAAIPTTAIITMVDDVIIILFFFDMPDLKIK